MFSLANIVHMAENCYSCLLFYHSYTVVSNIVWIYPELTTKDAMAEIWSVVIQQKISQLL